MYLLYSLSQDPYHNHICKVPLPHKVTYSQVWGLGHGHLHREMILPSTGSILVENQMSKCAAFEYKGFTKEKGTQNDSPSITPTLHNFLNGYNEESQTVPRPFNNYTHISTLGVYAAIYQVAGDLDLLPCKQ